MNRQKGFIEMLALFFMFGLIVLAVVAVYESPEENHAIYSAWVKANPTVALTFEEWKLLRNEGLLPGQQVTANNTATGVAIGTAIGAGMASGARR